MARDNLVKVFVSVTTLDRTLARRMEPRAPTPEKRLEAIEALNDAGVPAGVMAAPIVPAINDEELEKILTRAYSAGAREGAYVVLRLPGELRDMFREWLQVNYPERLKRAVSLMQSMREGKDYEAQWGRRMAGSGPYAWMIGRRFEYGGAAPWLPRDLAGAAHRPLPQADREGARRRAAQPVLTRSAAFPAAFGPCRGGGRCRPGRSAGPPSCERPAREGEGPKAFSRRSRARRASSSVGSPSSGSAEASRTSLGLRPMSASSRRSIFASVLSVALAAATRNGQAAARLA